MMSKSTILLIFGLIAASSGLPGPFVKRDTCEIPMKQISDLRELMQAFLNSDKSDQTAKEIIVKIKSEKYDSKPDQCYTTLQDTRTSIINVIELTVKLQQSNNRDELQKLQEEITEKKESLEKDIKELQEQVEDLTKELNRLKAQGVSNDFIMAVYYTILGDVEKSYQIFQKVNIPDKVNMFLNQAYRASSIKSVMQFLEKMPTEQTRACQIIYQLIFLNDDAINPRVYHFDYYVHKFVEAGTATLDIEKYRRGLRDGIIEKMKEIGLALADDTQYRTVYQYEADYPGFFNLYLELLISVSMEQDREAGHHILNLFNKFPTVQKARILIQMFEETKIGNQDYPNMLSLPPRIAYILKNFINTSEYHTLPEKARKSLEAINKSLNKDRFMSVVGETVRFSWPMQDGKKSYLAVTTKKTTDNAPWIYLDNPDVPNDWQPIIDWNVKTVDNGRSFLLEPKGMSSRYLNVDRDNNITLADEIADENRWLLLDYPHNGRLDPSKDEYSGEQFICTLYNLGFFRKLMIPGDEWPRPPRDIIRMISVNDGKRLDYTFTSATTWVQNYWEVLPTSNSI